MSMGPSNPPCRTCRGEAVICRQTGRPWSVCDCGWCERGSSTKVSCPICKAEETKLLPAEVAKAINDIRVGDDRLGRYSDYEGNEDGSTYMFWMQGSDPFASQIARAIADHQASIRAWTQLALLNHRYRNRKPKGETE